MAKVDHSQERALAAALDSVSSTGQALAAADLCLATLKTVRDRFGGWGWGIANAFTLGLYGLTSPDRMHAMEELDGARVDLERAREPMAGPSQPITADAVWSDLRHAIDRAYVAIWAISEVEGQGDEWDNIAQWSASVASESIAAMPGVAAAAIGVVTTEATDLTGGILAGLVKGLWPVLLIAGAALAIGVVVLGSGGVAGVAKKVVG
jgi:hypothetical protein